MTCNPNIPPPEERSIDVSPVVGSLPITNTPGPTNRLRLSAAAFDHEQSLDRAERALAQVGIDEAGLVILLCTSNPSAASSSGSRRLAPTEISVGARLVLASDPAMARRLLEPTGAHDQLGQDLRTLLESHAIVLVALAETFSRHRKAVRILLKHAESRVFTSDLNTENSVAVS